MNINRKKRNERLSKARTLGIHTYNEWMDMIIFFEGFCVRCLAPDKYSTKDHIIPIYQGGSDGIDNIQPLCKKCNSSKASESIDYRPKAAKYLRKNLPAEYHEIWEFEK
ncbi:MAG: HNH endonuclease signature motif containing protein [Bacteroidia bacterium]